MDYLEIYRIIGKNILERRTRLGFSQQDLARLAAVDRSKISDIENGKEDFMFSTILKISHALDSDLRELLKESDEE